MQINARFVRCYVRYAMYGRSYVRSYGLTGLFRSYVLMSYEPFRISISLFLGTLLFLALAVLIGISLACLLVVRPLPPYFSPLWLR
jgi:hypothetical protein